MMMEKNKFPLARIYEVEETGTSEVQKLGYIIGPYGQK
jgi:hypothetical protein